MTSRKSLCIAAISLVAGCGERDSASVIPTEPNAAVITPLATDQVVDGSTGPGSIYRMVRPANWNGTLLVYAHGSVDAGTPVSLPSYGDLLVDALAPEGVAVAFSSFSETGWNIADGARRTHQLTGLFTSKFGRPTTTIVAGKSMGGLIAIKLAEDYPTQYAGSLPICSVAGGTRRQADYDANVWTLFEYYYPGVLPGNAAFLPPDVDWFEDIYVPAYLAMWENPGPVSKIIAIDQAPVPGTTLDQQMEGIAYALGLNQFFLGSLEPKGEPYFDNRLTTYTGATLPASELLAVNAGVRRYSASRNVINAMEHNYNPTGRLKRPMLMLSGSFDPNVPAFNQVAYLAAATKAGTTPFLVQRTLQSDYHCYYDPFSDVVLAFHDLLTWSQSGVKPAP